MATMTPRGQQKAIAEACHYVDVKPHSQNCQDLWGVFVTGSVRVPIPNYLADLNAMREARMALSWHEQARYIELLVEYGDREGVCWLTRSWAEVQVSAQKEAELFLRAKGLWKDGKPIEA